MQAPNGAEEWMLLGNGPALGVERLVTMEVAVHEVNSGRGAKRVRCRGNGSILMIGIPRPCVQNQQANVLFKRLGLLFKLLCEGVLQMLPGWLLLPVLAFSSWRLRQDSLLRRDSAC